MLSTKVSTPTYELALPSSGQLIKFRPFLMKEEKILLMAAESTKKEEQLHALSEIVKNCTFGVIDIETSPIFDVQYIFLHLRAKSVGEVAEFYLICGSCENKRDTTLDLEKVVVSSEPEHTNTIQLSDAMTLTMKYPTIVHSEMIADGETLEKIYSVICENMDKLYDGDEAIDCSQETIDEKTQFLDGLTAQQFQKIRLFYETMPVLNHTFEYVCEKCETPNKTVIEDVASFFV